MTLPRLAEWSLPIPNTERRLTAFSDRPAADTAIPTEALPIWAEAAAAVMFARRLFAQTVAVNVWAAT